VALNLGGVETSDPGRGDTLLTPGSLEVTTMLDAVVEVVPGGKALRHGTRVRFHQGTHEVLGRVAVAGMADGTSSEVRSPTSEVAEIPAGGRAYIRLRLESPAVVTRGDRYILRAYSPPMTIAGGAVIDPRPARGGIRNAAWIRSRVRSPESGVRSPKSAVRSPPETRPSGRWCG
jgi:selenocysteine-specific elongation factor